MKLTVELVEELGADTLVHGAVNVNGSPELFVVRIDGRTPPAMGETVTLALREADRVHLFHPATGARLAA